MFARRNKSAFTLVEILIVVIILGILAAIVIPQFTNASQDARVSSLRSQVQTLRSQVELFKLEHLGQYPTADGTAATAFNWQLLTDKSTETATPPAVDNAAGTKGPYIQSIMINPLNQSSTWAAAPGAGVGYVLDAMGKIYGVDLAGTGLVE